jgi:hypothetical protein
MVKNRVVEERSLEHRPVMSRGAAVRSERILADRLQKMRAMKGLRLRALLVSDLSLEGLWVKADTLEDYSRMLGDFLDFAEENDLDFTESSDMAAAKCDAALSRYASSFALAGTPAIEEGKLKAAGESAHRLRPSKNDRLQIGNLIPTVRSAIRLIRLNKNFGRRLSLKDLGKTTEEKDARALELPGQKDTENR